MSEPIPPDNDKTPAQKADLFGLLVRLEVQGWSTGSPEASVEPPAGLAPLLRKVAWLQAPLDDGGERYDLRGLPTPELVEWFFGRGVEVRRITGPEQPTPGVPDATYVSIHAENDVRFWRLAGIPSEEDGQIRGVRVTAVAFGVEDWIQQLLDGSGSAGVIDPAPLPDLNEVGDGVGWRLADLIPPVRLGGLPEEVEGEPYELDGELLWAGQRVLPMDDYVTESVPGPDAPQGAKEPDLDELFGKEGSRARPRTARIMGLLLSGILLTVLGMACIAAPGGILVLLAWMTVETDQQRLESGYLPASDAAEVERTRRFTYAGLLLVVFLFALQAILLCNGAYDLLLDGLYIPVWQAFVRGLLGGAG